MAETIAMLQAIIGADVSGLRRGMQEARGELTSFGDRLFSAGSQVAEFGLRLQGLTGPIRQAFGAGISVASSFQDVMVEIGARAGLTAEQMETVSQAALQLGSDTVFSAQQAAEGYLQLMTAGMSVEEALATLPAVLDAAAASGESVGRAADGITNIMSGFRGEVLDAAHVADMLARAAGATPASMGEMMDAIASVGPIADQMGLSFDDVVGVMTQFADSGLRGAEAGTMLRRMLMQMTDGTENTQAAWERLGTSFYTAEGALRPFPDIISEMQAGLAGLASSAERNEVIRDLAGTYSALGLSLLASGEGLEETGTRLAEQASVSDVAAARMGTFSGATDSLQGSIEALATEVLTPFMNNTLTPLVGKIQEVVDSVTDWARENPELAGTITAIGGAILLVGPLLFGFGLALEVIAGIVAVGGTLVLGLRAAGAGFMSMLGPIGLVALAILGLIVFAEQLIDLLNQLGKLFKSEEPWGLELAGRRLGPPEWFRQERPALDEDRVGLGGIWMEDDDLLSGRAAGGPVMAGTPYLVGERGMPEIFIPRVSGYIAPIAARLPGGAGGGGRQVVINLTANGISDPVRLVDMVSREMRRRTF